MNEAHQRFHDWLTAGAEGDPPRDVAVHASVCAECRQSIAAFDRLSLVNPGLASVPAEPTGRERGRLAGAGRLIGATVILFSALILGVGVSQLTGVSRTNAPVAQASSTPDQNVLGETATPQPGPEVPPTPEGIPSETLTPLGTPVPTHPQPLVTPIPRRTAAPTPIPTAIATPIGLPTNSPAPTVVPTPAPTPVPTATPTPIPTAPAAITNLVASPGSNTGEINLTWSAPTDGGSPITSYELCRGMTQGDWPTCFSVGLVTSFTDSGLTPALQYWYVVRAVNVIGTGSNSNEGSATAAP